MTAGSSWRGGCGEQIVEMRACASVNNAKFAISEKFGRGEGEGWRQRCKGKRKCAGADGGAGQRQQQHNAGGICIDIEIVPDTVSTALAPARQNRSRWKRHPNPCLKPDMRYARTCMFLMSAMHAREIHRRKWRRVGAGV